MIDAGGPPPRTGLALLRRALRRQRRALACGYPLIVLWQLCEAFVPIAIGVVVDRGIASDDGTDMLWCVALLVGVFLVLATSYRVGIMHVVRATELESHLLRLEIAGKVLRPRGSRSTLLAGETLSLATSDAALAPRVLHHLGFTLATLVALVGSAGYLLSVDLGLALTVLLGVPVVVATIQVATPLVARRTTTQQERTARASGLATDLVTGVRVLKGIGGEQAALRRYRSASGDAGRATVALARSWGRLAGLTTALSGGLLAVVTWMAGRQALDGDISLGELVAVVGLTQFLAEPIGHLGDISARFAQSRAAADRITAALAAGPLVADGAGTPVGDPPPLVLAGVSAGSLRGLDLHAGDGELLAVVAPEPADAEALVGLLVGSLESEAGDARLGGTPLVELAIDARRRTLVVSGHHAAIETTTLREVVDPAGRLSADRLAAVLRASCAHEVVALHPDRLDRTVSPETLSGGQRQRLALARALATAAPVLVLADPTSAVDAVTEQTIAGELAALRRADRGTTVVLTSSPALLTHADRVVVLAGGRVVAEGSHAELLAQAPYREVVLR